jgi:hypothetical protein
VGIAGRDPLPALLTYRGFIHNPITGRNLEDSLGRVGAGDVGHGNGLLAGARVVVLNEHVQMKIVGIPVFIDDHDRGLPRSP